MQNHWTVKYRSCWPSLHDPQVHITRMSHVWPTICTSCFHNRKSRSHGMKAGPPGYLQFKYKCFLMTGWWDIPHLRNFNVNLWSNSIIPKYDVHTSTSLQDIRQNHWTLKYRSCWPSLHDTQVNVTRLSHVWPTICISCFHKGKVEKHFLKMSYIFTSSPTLGHGPWVQESWNESPPPSPPPGTYGPNMNAFWWVFVRYTPLEKLSRNSVKNFVVNSTNVTDIRTKEHTNGKAKTIYPSV